jgi:hypothetical protein
MTRTLTATDRSALIRLASSLPVGSPERRVVLAGLDKVAEDGDEEKDSGGSGKPSGKFIEFMEEVGDQKVRNPDTGNEVKVKSLKGEKGKALVQKEFQKWLKEPKKDEPKKKDEAKKNEPKKKDEAKKKDDKGDKSAPTPFHKKPASELMADGQSKQTFAAIFDIDRYMGRAPFYKAFEEAMKQITPEDFASKESVDALFDKMDWDNEVLNYIGSSLSDKKTGPRDRKKAYNWLDALADSAHQKAQKGKKASSDRSALIRLASAMPAGSDERRAILAGLFGKPSASDEVKQVLNEVARYFKGRGMDVDLETRLWVGLNIVDPWESGAGIRIVPSEDGLDVSLVQGGRARSGETVRRPSARAVINAVKDVARAEDYIVDRA